MRKLTTLVAVSALALAVTVSSQPASARGGALAAGIIGGIAVGAIVGSQVNGGYYGPGYYQSEYQPVYSNCHIERQRMEDGYGNIRVRRIRVCD